ncbi:MAG TPA: ABC transporter ATP-binding protein [Lachnospiraceae bacterium]|nr:ABC transporter ATP-binding protein [Lachnospiraceae bacterium]
MNIEIEKLTKIFKNGVTALDHLDMQMGEGIYGLLGKNGAGKTTLMRILTTLMEPSSGSVNICGNKLCKENYNNIRQLIGYLPQELGLYPNLSVRESLDYIGGIYGLDRRTRKERLDNLLEQTNLSENQTKKNKQLSGGMKRRVGLVQAMLCNPKILIVDEPTAGLDPEERIRIRSLLSDFGSERTVILSTHMIEDLAATCNHIFILNQGKVKYDGTVDEMMEKVSGHVYNSLIKDEKELLSLQDKYAVTGKIYTNSNINVRFVSATIPELECNMVEANLEDAYIFLNNKDAF